ncbi:MAG TPA: SRPBCC family protein, partial [Solirubrobacterales bacterium]|nr:SRPBCC family protein [Solirubrobacterales bacterium]
GPPIREETIVYERPSRFSYKVLSGLPVRDHVGTVSLEPDGDGRTKITYALRTTPTVPIAGGVVVGVVKQGVKQLLNGVSAEAERRVAAGG